MSNMSKFVAALVGLLLMILVASRQLFLFAVLRDPAGLSITGGRSHLFLAAVAGATACFAGGLMSYFFSRYERNKWSKVQITPTGPLLPLSALNPSNWLKADQLAARRWALANPWLAEGQADDRRPMDGSVADSGETPSGQRAFARRIHQVMFKKWSQARHD
jgi:hypothetical protein